MKTYWVTLSNGKKGCVELIDDRDVIKLVWDELGEEVLSYTPLPYPANPRLISFTHPELGKCPSFCYNPERCKGNTSCPDGRRSCTE